MLVGENQTRWHTNPPFHHKMNAESNRRYSWYMRALVVSFFTGPGSVAIGLIMGKSDLSEFTDTADTYDTQFTPMGWLHYLWYPVWIAELLWIGYMYFERNHIGVHEFAASIGMLSVCCHVTQSLFVYGWVYELPGMTFAFAVLYLFRAFMRSRNTTALTITHKWMFRWTRCPKLASSWASVLFTLSLLLYLVDYGTVVFYSTTVPALVIYLPAFLSILGTAIPPSCCDNNRESGLGRDVLGAFILSMHLLAVAVNTRDGESTSVTALKSFGAALSILVTIGAFFSVRKWGPVFSV